VDTLQLPACDSQTDGQTTSSKDRAMLCVAWVKTKPREEEKEKNLNSLPFNSENFSLHSVR